MVEPSTGPSLESVLDPAQIIIDPHHPLGDLIELAQGVIRLKIGGLALGMQVAPWQPGDSPSSEQIADFWRAEVRWCIEQFGVDRCMFESNFPIDRSVVSYLNLWNAYKRIIADCSTAERNALFHDTARRTYSRGEVAVA